MKLCKIPPSISHYHLQRLLRYFSSSSSPSTSPLSPLSNPISLHHHLSFLRNFSSLPQTPPSEIAQSIATQLLKPEPENPSLPLQQRLSLHFSHVDFNPLLILQTLNLSSDAGRNVLSLHRYLSQDRPDVKLDDSSLRYFVEHLGRNKDFKAIDEFLTENRGVAGPECFRAAVNRLVRAGRPTQVIAFFDRMEKDYGFVRNRESLFVVVSALCEHGFASHAERFVKQVADEIFPDEAICDALVRGWCVDEKYDEARRLVGEITRGGFELGTSAYNALLDCVCKLCRKKDPFRVMFEAEKVLVEMETVGVPRDVGTFNVLISNLCKIRKTEDAVKLFDRMGEWGCSPDAETFILLTRSLYQAARIAEGDEMIDRMKSAGFGKALDKKIYYGFVKILCGIERIDHALKVFVKMKKDGCTPGIKTYDLLMGKLCAHGRVDRANALFHEAEKKGVPVTPKPYKVDPRFAKKPKVKKEKPQRETLPMKMARKRRKLRKLRLSFVKKPKRGMRMRY
ncbi:small ribosomal subunit protein mL104 (rPPR9) [Magnolia sinica]|uniref:small ribosomal subunit protein mL104 (rPPR9) n=1 Tax=Magnolia sinica TaxID=86752 RepID=UPI002657B06B|nr:small ribosomal subunit protein mL104 (rPPR9) [Magnolia sinica]